MGNFKQELFKEVAVQLKNARLSNGLTQRDLAKVCNSTQVVINNVENSKVVPSLATLVKLCECLDLKINLTYSDGSTIKPPLLDSKERALLKPLADYCRKVVDLTITLYRTETKDELKFYAINGDYSLEILSIAVENTDFLNLNGDTEYVLSDLGL